MMPKSEEAPVVSLCKTLTVFYRHVDAVVRAIEVPASRRFLTRAVWERRVKNPGQFFYNDRSFWKLACLQIGINVFLLDVHVMVFGEVRLGTVRSAHVAVVLSIIEALGSQGGTHKHPLAKARRQLHSAISVKYHARLFSLGSRNRFRDQQVHG